MNGRDGEQQEMYDFLLNRIGVDEDEARRRMRDSDLWLVGPDFRLGLHDEEAVAEWRKTVQALDALVDVADHMCEGVLVAVMDTQERVGIALQRARERVREAG